MMPVSVSHGAPQARDMYAKTVTPGGVSYFGAEVFWYGDRAPGVRALDAAYYFASDSSGLALHAGENVELWSRGVTRWFRFGLSVADSFVCRCLMS
jgi:hypothetical protein